MSKQRCFNCDDSFKRVADAKYKFRYVHDNRTCPYGFDFAHDNPKVIWGWIRDLQRAGFSHRYPQYAKIYTDLAHIKGAL